MMKLLLSIALLSQTSVDNRNWQDVLAECIAGNALVSEAERQQVVGQIRLDDDEATRTAKLSCIYFSTERNKKARYGNNSAVSLATLLDLGKSPRLSHDELGLISLIVCLSIDVSSAGEALEKQLWKLSDQLPTDKQSVVVSAFRLAAWENADNRIARMKRMFGSDKSSNEIRESVILAVGGALVENRLGLDQCVRIFSELHQQRECTDKNDSQMMKLLSEHIETEKVRSIRGESIESGLQTP